MPNDKKSNRWNTDYVCKGGGCLPARVSAHGGSYTSPPRGQTDAYKNITFPQLLFRTVKKNDMVWFKHIISIFVLPYEGHPLESEGKIVDLNHFGTGETLINAVNVTYCKCPK